jgi:hypothetical protein
VGLVVELILGGMDFIPPSINPGPLNYLGTMGFKCGLPGFDTYRQDKHEKGGRLLTLVVILFRV